jgi:hypothetical protein
MSDEKTPAVIRRFTGGNESIIALFPQEPADPHGQLCVCYQHVGQHGSADTEYVMENSAPATAAEAAPLLEELRDIGYELKLSDEIDHELAREIRAQAIRTAAAREAGDG